MTCNHVNRVPVRTQEVFGAELVAYLCTDCDEQLEVGYENEAVRKVAESIGPDAFAQLRQREREVDLEFQLRHNGHRERR